ncbi:MAG: hypothetical protein RQ745_06470 [Longimicrobiales bacterium]|nr:hypothetical protein [Longimicrobiales bacterium]
MKTMLTGLMVAVGTVALGAMPAASQSAEFGALLGAWEMQRETPQGQMMTIRVTFVAEGDSVVARVGEGDALIPLGRVEFDGETVRFPIEMRALMAGRGGRGARTGAAGPPSGRGGGEMPTFTYEGRLDGDRIVGGLETPRGAQEFVLERVRGG